VPGFVLYLCDSSSFYGAEYLIVVLGWAHSFALFCDVCLFDVCLAWWYCVYNSGTHGSGNQWEKIERRPCINCTAGHLHVGILHTWVTFNLALG